MRKNLFAGLPLLPSGLLALSLALAGGTLFGETAIEFNTDDRQTRIEVAAKSCTALLDDDTNYQVTTVDDHTFVVATKATSEQSALLIVDCAGKTFPYTLSFRNHSKYEYEDTRYRPGIERPNSYFGYGHFAIDGAPAANSFEAFDQSYRPLGVAVSRSYLDPAHMDRRVDSIDFYHSWDDTALSYGTSSGRDANGREASVRSYLGAFGGALGAQQTYRDNTRTEESYLLGTPAPLALRFLYYQAPDGALDRRIQRSFFAGAGLVTSNTVLEWERYAFPEIEEDYTQANAFEDLRYLGIPWIRPGLETGGFARRGDDSPKLNLTRLKSEFRYDTSYLELSYGLVPHDIGATARYKFHRGQEASVMVSQSYSPLPWVTHQPWISNEATPGVFASWAASPLHSSALLHLEYSDSPYTFTADHDIPIHRNSGDERLFGRLGVQVDRPQLAASASVGFPYDGSMKVAEFWAEIRYYPDTNIKTMVARTYHYSVSGRVLSVFADKPLGGAHVSLQQDGVPIATCETTTDGKFTFAEVRAGTYTIMTQKGVWTKQAVIELSGEKREITTQLVINDYARINVVFLLVSEKTADITENSTPAAITNFLPELGEGIVSYEGASYTDNLIWVPRQGAIQLKINRELISYDYVFVGLKGGEQDTNQEEEGLVQVLLRKKK